MKIVTISFLFVFLYTVIKLWYESSTLPIWEIGLSVTKLIS